MSNRAIALVVILIIGLGVSLYNYTQPEAEKLGKKHIKCKNLETKEITYHPMGQLVKISDADSLVPEYEILFNDENMYDIVLINQECEVSAFKKD